MSMLFRTQKCLTILQLTRAWGLELAKGEGESEQHVHDLTHILLQDIINGRLDDSGPLWDGRRSGVGFITADYKVGFIEGRYFLEPATSEPTKNWVLRHVVVMKEAVLDFASRHEMPPPSWWADGSSVSPDAGVTTMSSPSIAASPIQAPTHSARLRGRKAKKLNQVKETMREDVRLGRETPDGLRGMLEKDLAANYRVSRLESLVVRRIRDWLADPASILQVIQQAVSNAATQKRLIERARDFVKQDHDRGFEGLRAFMRASIVRVQVHADRIDIMLDQDQVCRCLDETAKKVEPSEKTPSEANRGVTTVSIPARLKRTGKEMRIIVDDGSEPATPDTSLVRLLVRANAIRDQLLADRSLTFEDIAKSEDVVPSYATRLFRLTLLAPDIINAILSGKHPPELTARRLMDDTRLALEWNEQRQCLGFESAY